MRSFVPTAACALIFLGAGVAAADHRFEGTYELDGRTSRGRHTEARLRITESAPGCLRVVRRGETGREDFTWVSTDVSRLGRDRLQVIYRVGRGGAGLRGRVRGRRGRSGADVFRAEYDFSFRGRRVRERVRNLTRRGSAHCWRSLETSGSRHRGWGRASTRVIRRSTSSYGTVHRSSRWSGPHRSSRTVIVRSGRGHHGRVRGLPRGSRPSVRVHRRARHHRGYRRHRRRSHAGVSFSTRSGGARFSFSIGTSR